VQRFPTSFGVGFNLSLFDVLIGTKAFLLDEDRKK
jgi:hypothetical protein